MKPGIIRCPNCDAPLRKTAKVCPRCETRLDNNENSITSTWLPTGARQPVAGTGIIDKRPDIDKAHGDTSSSIKCPSCGSDQITSQKKGYGLGKGLAGGFLVGPVGFFAGLLGHNIIEITCLKCGKKWTAGDKNR